MGKSTFVVDALALGRKLIVLYKKAVGDVEKMEQRRINNGKIQISAFRIGSKSKEKPPISFEISGFYGASVHNVLDEKHRHEYAYSTVPQRYLCFRHKKRGIIMKKVKIKLDDMERRILVKLLYEKRNELIREGGYAGSIDELILKLVDAK